MVNSTPLKLSPGFMHNGKLIKKGVSSSDNGRAIVKLSPFKKIGAPLLRGAIAVAVNERNKL